MPLPDPRRSRALLIGAAAYEHLPELPAVANNLTALAEVLTAQDLGGLAPEHVTSVPGPRDIRDVYDRVAASAAEAEDVLLVYFAGHGLLGRGNDLYLAVADTRPGALPVTGLAYDHLRDLVLESPARSKVVILDCCFSGQAVDGMSGDDSAIVDQMGIEGTYVLTATPATRQALAPKGETYTAFTGMLLNVLRGGVEGGGELLTLRDVYARVRRDATAKGRPVPQVRGTGTVDGLALVRNAARGTAGTEAAPVVPARAPAPEPVPGPVPEPAEAVPAGTAGALLDRFAARSRRFDAVHKSFAYRSNFTRFMDLGDTWEDLEAERVAPIERTRAVGRLVWWTFLSGLPQLVVPVLACTAIGFAVDNVNMKLSFALALLAGLTVAIVVAGVRARRVSRLGTAYAPPLDEWLRAVPLNAGDWLSLLLRTVGWFGFLVFESLVVTAKGEVPAGSRERLTAVLVQYGIWAGFLVISGLYARLRFNPWDEAYREAKAAYLGEGS